MLSVADSSSYAECHCAECHYAECRDANQRQDQDVKTHAVKPCSDVIGGKIENLSKNQKLQQQMNVSSRLSNIFLTIVDLLL